MALIKCGQSKRLMKEAVVLDMGDLGRQAERMMAHARAEASRIVDQARAEAQRLVAGADETGHAQGFARGLAEGRETGRVEGRQAAIAECSPALTQLMQGWTDALEQWQRDREQMLDQAREDVIQFAFMLGERITHRLVRTDPTIVRDQLRDTLNLLSRVTAAEVAVHPQDRALAAEVVPELLAAAGRSMHVVVHEDESIARGGCVIATANGRVDATIETQLDRIAEALVPEPRVVDSSSNEPGVQA